MQPNRLERDWKKIGPEILRRWSRLTPADLEACQGQFDLVVEAIRKTYTPGRSHLTLEGEIRDWLVEKLQKDENSANRN